MTLNLARNLSNSLKVNEPDIEHQPNSDKYLADGTLEHRIGFLWLLRARLLLLSSWCILCPS